MSAESSVLAECRQALELAIEILDKLHSTPHRVDIENALRENEQSQWQPFALIDTLDAVGLLILLKFLYVCLKHNLELRSQWQGYKNVLQQLRQSGDRDISENFCVESEKKKCRAKFLLLAGRQTEEILVLFDPETTVLGSYENYQAMCVDWSVV